MIRRGLVALFSLAIVVSLFAAPAAAQEAGRQAVQIVEGGRLRAAPQLVLEADPASGPEQPAPTGKGTALAFWIFAFMAVGGAITTITRKNAITAVMCLVGTFFAIAGVYAMLFASFMAVIQVLVYAGAIMVLFVFVVMILNKEEEEPWTHRGFVGKVLSLAGIVYLVGRLAIMLWNMRPAFVEKTWAAGEFAAFGTTKSVGAELFTTYLFPFEAISIALLVAIVGAVVLAHPDHPTEKAPGPGPGPGHGEAGHS